VGCGSSARMASTPADQVSQQIENLVFWMKGGNQNAETALDRVSSKWGIEQTATISAPVDQQMERSWFRASTPVRLARGRFSKFRCAQIEIVRFRVECHRLGSVLGLEGLDFAEFSG